MRKKKRQEETLDFLEGRIHREGGGMEKEREEFETLQRILAQEKNPPLPPNFWASYLPNLRRRMQKKRHRDFVPALVGGLSLLFIAFLLFHSRIFPPNLPPLSHEKGYGERRLSGINSEVVLEELSTSLVQAFGLDGLIGSLEDLMERPTNWEELGDEDRERLLGALACQLGEEADYACDLIYQGLDIEEATGELSSDELLELEMQLRRKL